ncbi:histone H2B.2-like [Phoenix dactylifera]|uniref:Histone H2B.2-like n=1 Tax=Phoenix dactylifera TaxID=42345 RepID=A0A8B8ZH87_PHODC|nr:histone H2B.2-like [Phoenix dactylifera]
MVVGTLVKNTKKVVEETLQVSVEDGEGNWEQPPPEESKVVEVVVEEKKAQESQTSVPSLARLADKRKEECKEYAKEVAEEPPKRDEKQEKEARGEEEKVEPPKRREKRKKEGVVEGEERGERNGEEGVGGGYKRNASEVLKQVHTASLRAVVVLDGMMTDMFETPVDEAARLSKYTRKAMYAVVKGDPCCSAPSANRRAPQA